MLYVEVGLGRCLKEDQVVFLGKPLPLFGTDLAPAVQIRFVAYEHHHYVWVSVLSHFLQPSGQVVEGLFAGDVVHQQSTGGSSVVGPRYAFKGFLASGVPDLQLDVLLVNFDCPTAELYADGQVVLLSEPLVGKLKEQA